MSTTRRDFLIGGLRISACIPAVGLIDLASRSTRRGAERVLVVLELAGGNDGLNTLVPFRQDPYYRARPTLGLPRNTLHALDDDFGLHEKLGPLARLHADGRLCTLHAVGYPDPNRSHFRSMEIWHTADPRSRAGDDGWLGRLAVQIARQDPEALPALQIGGGEPSLALFGARGPAPTIHDEDGFHLADSSPVFARFRDRLVQRSWEEPDQVRIASVAKTAYSAAQRMSDLAAEGGGGSYPGSELGQKLRLVARLIRGGFGTRIFHVSHGGYDTHARQVATHAALLEELGAAVGAFQLDLKETGLDESVVTFIHSEFGRRVAENGSRGTDHGAAAPVFLIGEPVRGGLQGTPADLERLEGGDVAMRTDFRSVYATLERSWLGLESSSQHEPLPLLS